MYNTSVHNNIIIELLCNIFCIYTFIPRTYLEYILIATFHEMCTQQYIFKYNCINSIYYIIYFVKTLHNILSTNKRN